MEPWSGRNKQRINGETGGLYILRIASVLLAIVSWWSTARGMEQFVFTEAWQANLASLGVQSILLGLNFYLPTFFRSFKGYKLRKAILGLLCAIVLICSSVFSYIYIADKVYEQSWNTEGQLLVQASYRNELYEASDYAKTYEKFLQDSLSTQISELYSEVQNIIKGEKSETTSALDLSEGQKLLENTENIDFSASYYLRLAMDAVAAATQENVSDSDIEKAIEDAKLAAQGVETTITKLSEEIEDLKDAISYQKKQLDEARDDDDSGIDIEAVQSRLTDLNESLNELQDDRSACEQASRIIQQYQSELQRVEGGVGTDALRDLQEIHTSLLDRTMSQTELDEVQQRATNLFGELQNMEVLSDGEGGISFTLLNQMNQMIQNLEDYARIREDREKLDNWADQLQTTLDDQEKDEEQPKWKSDWVQKMDELRAVIGGLPVYDGDDSQILRNYDRGDAMDRMDKTIQQYITEHNPADQSIIYLISPYRGMALFALALAFFLDIAAFITGLIVDTVEAQRKKGDEPNGGEMSEVGVFGGYPVIPATRRRYVYLTGNYTKENGQYYCQAFEGMEEKEIVLPETQIASGCRGFFVDTSKSSFRMVAASTLAFAKTQGGPRDGVYRNCILKYMEHMLSIQGEKESTDHFLANVEGDTPVYRVLDGECAVLPLRDLLEQRWDTAIFALNSAGTMISAIYLVKEQGTTGSVSFT